MTSSIHNHIVNAIALVKEHFANNSLIDQVVLAEAQGRPCNEVSLYEKMLNDTENKDFWCIGRCKRVIINPKIDLNNFTMLEIAKKNTTAIQQIDEVIKLVAIFAGFDPDIAAQSAIRFEYVNAVKKGQTNLPNRICNITVNMSWFLSEDTISNKEQHMIDYESAMFHIRSNINVKQSVGKLIVLYGMPPDPFIPNLAMGNDRFEIYAMLEPGMPLVELANVYIHNTNVKNRRERGDINISSSGNTFLNDLNDTQSTVTDVGIGVERCMMVGLGFKTIKPLENVIQWVDE